MLRATSIRKKVYGFLMVVALVALAGHFGYEYFSSGGVSAEANSDLNAEEKVSDEELTPVELSPTVRGEISAYLTATANLRALREVDVVSQTEGLVYDSAVEEGDVVEEGQVLCRLDDRQLQISLQSAKQKLAQAKLQFEKAEIRREKAQTQINNGREELNRYEKLYAESLVSEREVAQLRYRLDELLHDERASFNETRELTHRVDELESEIAQVELEISQTLVKAPFSGMITERVVERGQTVRKLDQLFRLSSFSTLYADVYLSEREARRVHGGQPATVTVGADNTLSVTGKVARISPVVDQSTGTVKVTVSLRAAHEVFKPGAFVSVAIRTDTRDDSVLVPKRAILEEDGQHYVFVVEDRTAHRVEVELGFETNGKTEVRRGLIEGQKVVVAGQGTLKDGAKIKVVEG